MTRLRMAVIGVGHLGKEHARILAGLPQVELVGVADINTEHAQQRVFKIDRFSDRCRSRVVGACGIHIVQVNYSAQ